MLWVPQKGRLLYQSNMGTVGDGTLGTAVTTGAASSTKGNYVELLTTTFDVYLIDIGLRDYGASATNAQCMVDIATAAATQEIIIPDLIGGSSQPRIVTTWYRFPLYIPSGTSISARAAGQRLSASFGVCCQVFGGNEAPPYRVGRKVTTYGVTTVPSGTTVVPGTSAGAGSHTEITASTSEDHFAVRPGFQWGDDTTKTTSNFGVAIGIGAATEEELSTVWMYHGDGGEIWYSSGPADCAFADIPSGSRLTMRASNSAASNDAGDYNGCIYGVS